MEGDCRMIYGLMCLILGAVNMWAYHALKQNPLNMWASGWATGIGYAILVSL